MLLQIRLYGMIQKGVFALLLGRFSVTRVCPRTRDWSVCVKFALLKYGSRDSTIRCVLSDSKMGTEVVGSLMHADASHRGNAPHSTPRPTCVYPALQ
jgi:hypothetical protein